MIDLQQLIQIAPFPAETKADIVAKINTLSDQQKRDLENLAWDSIIEDYENKIAFATQTALTQMAIGQSSAKDVALEKIEDEVFNEFISKMEGINTQEQIEEVREKLQAQSPK